MSVECRFCRAPLSRALIDLGDQAVANSYLPPDPAAIAAERRYPLRVMLCEQCWLAQLDTDLPADAIFHQDYAYFSSYSSSWVAHARRYAETMTARFDLGRDALVIEAASNDGYLLQHFGALGVPSLGVEPAANCAAAAREKGVETLVAFFNRETGERLAAEGRRADLTAANNVLAHVPDISDFVAGFSAVLKPEGVATFEFPHLLNLLRMAQFDTIYHEHYSYLSLLSVERIFAAHGLRVFDVEELPTHGGSLRVFACLDAAAHAPRSGLERMRAAEAHARLDHCDGYAGLEPEAQRMRDGFRDYLAQARAERRRVAGYGAAAKGNTFLNYCGADAGDLLFVVDRNPEKQNRLLPGSHIPVRGPDALREEKPDDVLILPWNLAGEIAAEHDYLRAWGGRFLVACPALRIL